MPRFEWGRAEESVEGRHIADAGEEGEFERNAKKYEAVRPEANGEETLRSCSADDHIGHLADDDRREKACDGHAVERVGVRQVLAPFPAAALENDEIGEEAGGRLDHADNAIAHQQQVSAEKALAPGSRFALHHIGFGWFGAQTQGG